LRVDHPLLTPLTPWAANFEKRHFVCTTSPCP
jgi:hypothetical protein